MTPSGDQFQATIPAGSVDNLGVEYFIQATDLDGATSRTPAANSGFFSIPVTLADPGVVRGSAQPSGYQLVSIPIAATNSTASAVLVDDLGQYDDTQWRFFELRANQAYGEFTSSMRMSSGKAFWLIVRESGKTIDTGAGTTNTTSVDFSISLNAGFTFVGNPFNFNVPLSNVKMENGDALDIRSWSGTQFPPFSGSLQPFEGYLVASNEATNLLVDPILTPVTNSLPKQSDPPQLSKQKWDIHIFAHAQQAKDTLTVAAVNSAAVSEWDPNDLPEAPVIGEYVSVYFPHREWEKVFKSYTVDVRPEPLNGEIWEFTVRSNIDDEIRLSFMGLEDVPPEFQIRLLDEDLNISKNLRQDNTYSIAGSNEVFRKNLKLVVGKSAFFEDELTDDFVPPSSFELAQNFPNPFNPATSIKYSLPIESRVTLKIYNIKGAEIATLVGNDLQGPGHHLVIWNGTDKDGRLVASGIYVYQMSAGNLKISKKMAFLK